MVVRDVVGERRISGRVQAIALLVLVIDARQANGAHTEPGRILFSGCFEVLAGPICVVAPRTRIRFWVPANDATDVEVYGERDQLHPKLSVVADGFAFELEADKSRRVEVRSTATGTLLELGITTSSLSAGLELVVDANRLRREPGQLDLAIEKATLAVLAPEPLAVARAEGLLARMSMRRGEFELASSLFRSAIRRHDAIGSRSSRMLDSFALAFLLTHLAPNYTAARQVLDDAAAAAQEATEQSASLPYYRGWLAYVTGDYLEALSDFDDGAHAAKRLQLSDRYNDSRRSRLELLVRIGRCEEAIEILREITATDKTSSDVMRRAEVGTVLAWNLFLCADSQPGELIDEAEQVVGETLSLLDTIESPVHESAALGTRARICLLRRDAACARKAMERATRRAPKVEARLKAERMALRGLALSLEGDRSGAIAELEELARFAEKHQLPMYRWRAQADAARVLATDGEFKAALDMYRKAEAQLTALVALIPLGFGRDEFAADLERFTAEYVGVLLRLRMHKRALRVLLDGQARRLRLLDVAGKIASLPQTERREWYRAVHRLKSAQAQLQDSLKKRGRIASAIEVAALDAVPTLKKKLMRARREEESARAQVVLELNRAERTLRLESTTRPTQIDGGQVLVVVHRLAGRWGAFLQVADFVDHIFLAEEVDESGIARETFAAFESKLASAEEIGLIGLGGSDRQNLHDVSVGGAPLLARKRVTYVLPLGPSPRPTPVRSSALVVAPHRQGAELPKAADEAAYIAAALKRNGWDVTAIIGASATRARLLSALNDAEIGLVHYAGHASAASLGDGWESRLLLADGDVTAADILSLSSVPPNIVLSGCSAAKASGRAHGGLGVAQTLLLAGAHSVVATVRDVEDHEALLAMKEFYSRADRWAAGATFELTAPDSPQYRMIQRW